MYVNKYIYIYIYRITLNTCVRGLASVRENSLSGTRRASEEGKTFVSKNKKERELSALVGNAKEKRRHRRIQFSFRLDREPQRNRSFPDRWEADESYHEEAVTASRRGSNKMDPRAERVCPRIKYALIRIRESICHLSPASRMQIVRMSERVIRGRSRSTKSERSSVRVSRTIVAPRRIHRRSLRSSSFSFLSLVSRARARADVTVTPTMVTQQGRHGETSGCCM